MKTETANIPIQMIRINQATQLRVSIVGRGPALLLLHGGACDSQDWMAQVDVLSRGHRLILPDLVFGRSAPPDLDRRPQVCIHADECIQLLDVLHIEHVVLIGHSMGACVARQLYLTAPARVRALVVVDSRGALPQLYALPRSSGTASDFDLRRRQQLERDRQRVTNEWGEAINSLNTPEPDEPIGQWCKVPLLAFFSRRDGVFSSNEVEAVEKSLPSAQAKLVVVDDCGHWIMAEKPDLFNGYLTAFLTQLSHE